MLSQETEKCISRLLLNISTFERSSEITRQVLAQNIDFDLYQAFKVIDTEDNSCIDSINLMNFLRKNGVYSTVSDTQFIILFADENSDGLLSYSEFLNLVLTETNYTLRRTARERVGKANNKLSIPFNVEYSLVKLLEKELNLVRSTRIILEELKSRSDYNPHDIYQLLKGYNFITLESLKVFFDRLKVCYCDDDLKAIMKRLDFNNDSRVDFEEFHCLLAFPQCSKSCCHHQHCCCRIPMSSLINNNNNFMNQASTLSNNQNQSQRNTTLQQSPERDNIISLTSSDKEIKKISPYLSLRLSPERQYSPKRTSPIREVENNLNQGHYDSFRTNILPSHNGILNTRRSISRHNNLNKSIASYQNNSLKTNSPYHPLSSCICHASPCFCCQMADENRDDLFLNYFKDISSIEYQIEKAKIDLAIRRDFNVLDAFRIFEMEGRDFITESDLKYGLSQLEIFTSKSDIKLLMRRVDINKKGVIHFEDFFDMVTPFEKDYRAMVEHRIPSSCHHHCNKSNVFIIGTKRYLQNLLRLIISSENQLENIKLSLNKTREQIKGIFAEISMNKIGFNQMDLALYLKKKGVILTDQKRALAFIRLDRNRNGIIEYSELLEELVD